MERLLPALAITTVAILQGCAAAPKPGAAPITHETAPASPTHVSLCKFGECAAVHEGAAGGGTETTVCSASQGCAHGAEIGIEKNAPKVEGRPLTSVVVTQCSLIVAVYMTMPDGRLVRFDREADIPADRLVSIAYTAERSERVEVSCEGVGAIGYETHEAAEHNTW